MLFNQLVHSIGTKLTVIKLSEKNEKTRKEVAKLLANVEDLKQSSEAF